MSEKYRVHELGKFRYSDIGEYVDKYHTDRPLRNDILVELLNKQEKTIKELSEENEQLKQTIKGVYEILSIDVDVFSDKATEHDINAYIELKELDNKDAYYIAKGTKKAMELLKKVM